MVPIASNSPAVNGVAHAPSVPGAAAGLISAELAADSSPRLPLSLINLPGRAGQPATDVIVVDIKALFDVAEMFRYRWDAATLVCLGEGPMRFRALARRLGASIGDRVEDNALSRSLRRLCRTELITAECTTVGRRAVPLYTLTGKGQSLWNTYRALVVTYQELPQANDFCKIKQSGQRALDGPEPRPPGTAGKPTHE